MSKSIRISGIAIAASFAMLVAGCGGGGGGSSGTRPTTGAPSGTGTEFANLSPANAGYAATAASRAADARPRSGSVTQSSNVNNGITVDRVSVTAQHGVSRNSYSVRNGSSWSISTSDGNPVTIDATAPFDGQELYKRTNGGTLYVDVYSDIEAPSSASTSTGGQYNLTLPNINIGGRFVSTNSNYGGPATLDGVSGRVSCTGCSFVYTTGQLQMTAGSMEFTPSDGSAHTTLTADATGTGTPDTDYLAGGVWLFVPDNATSADDVTFGAFGDGNDPFRQSNLMALQGTARYVGGATGIYADRSENEVGYWDGEVTLTADFGGRSDLGSISGSVFGLESDGERYSGSFRLGAANIGASNSGFFEGRLSGNVEGVGFSGRWGGQFSGNSEADGKPGSVGGTLGGRSEDRSASFVGVFAAYKQ